MSLKPEPGDDRRVTPGGQWGQGPPELTTGQGKGVFFGLRSRRPAKGPGGFWDGLGRGKSTLARLSLSFLGRPLRDTGDRNSGSSGSLRRAQADPRRTELTAGETNGLASQAASFPLCVCFSFTILSS